MTIWVDADACPVKAEVLRVAERHRVPVVMVCNGGIRPMNSALVRIVVVPGGPDEADKRIAEEIAPGDICITGDLPLAARCIENGAKVLTHAGEELTQANIGPRLATRDLMADLRAADPFLQGGGKPFSRADRARFLERLERLLR